MDAVWASHTAPFTWSRLKQALYLLRHALICPIVTLLWYLDELLYPEYRDIDLRPVFIAAAAAFHCTAVSTSLVPSRLIGSNLPRFARITIPIFGSVLQRNIAEYPALPPGLL